MNYSSPLKPKKTKKEDDKLPLFKPEKLKISVGEAKRLLNSTKPISKFQTAWIQRWLEQLVRERCLPPQIAGADALGQLNLYLSPADCLKVLEQLRADFQQTVEQSSVKTDDDFAFLVGLGELEAYHEPLYHNEPDNHNTH